MKRLVFTILSTAAVCALVSATPALAGGADAHAGQDQAQIHPNEANQPPVWSANGVAEGEVYPAEQAYGPGYGSGAAEAGVVMHLPFGAAEAYAPAPYGADDASVPGRLSASAARERCHVVHVRACLRATIP
jgi:hypothetical protein